MSKALARPLTYSLRKCSVLYSLEIVTSADLHALSQLAGRAALTLPHGEAYSIVSSAGEIMRVWLCTDESPAVQVVQAVAA